MAAKGWLQTSGKLGGTLFLAANFAVMVLQPALLLAFLAFMTIAAAVAHLTTRHGGRIDVGWARGTPLARFRLRAPFGREAETGQFHDIRIHWFPTDVEVDGAGVPRITLLATSAFLVLGVVLSVWSFHLAGWSDLYQPGGPGSHLAAAAAPFEQRRPLTKVLEVKPGSPADRAGLRYGDVIVAAGGADWPTPLDFTRFLRSSDQVTLRIDRLGRPLQVALTRAKLPGWRRSGFGLVVCAALAFENHVAVEAVRYRGAAYQAGIRPGDEISVIPSGLYLSEGLLLEDQQRSSYRALVARRTPTVVVATVPASLVDEKWMASLAVRDLHPAYHPSLGESVRFSLAALASKVVMMGLGGARTQIQPFHIVHFHAHGPSARLLRKVLTATFLIGLYFLLCALSEKALTGGTLLFVFTFFGVTLGSRWVGFEAVDSGLLRLAESLPFGNLLFAWTL